MKIVKIYSRAGKASEYVVICPRVLVADFGVLFKDFAVC